MEDGWVAGGADVWHACRALSWAAGGGWGMLAAACMPLQCSRKLTRLSNCVNHLIDMACTVACKLHT